jgi:hypothetical protein
MSQPIDVKYDELLNWLLERYLIPKDWPKRLEAINIKKQEVIDEVYRKESPEFKKIQDTFKNVRNEMGYNDMMRLHQALLKTEEAKQKTLFGSYTAPVIKDSDLLINLYNKNNMNLCESSKLIIQGIGYEIPNCEKTIQYNERTISEYSAKAGEKNLMIERNNEKIKNLFKQYAIKETDDSKEIASRLVMKLNDLPKSLKEIENVLKNEKIKKIINGYQKFFQKIYHSDIENLDKEFLATLKQLNEKGDIINVVEKDHYDFISKSVTGILEQLQSSENLESAIWNLKLANTEGTSQGETKATSYLLTSSYRKKLINDIN